MAILVLNSGSSSIKFSLFEPGADESEAPRLLLDAEVTGVGGASAKLKVSGAGDTGLSAESFKEQPHTLAEAIQAIFGLVTQPGMPAVEAIGHRVVHPGAKLEDHARITREVLEDIRQAVAFAPLHDPAAIEVIHEAMQRFPDVAQFACFDTVFHRTMPVEATTYPLPQAIRDGGVRRYGFHGLSCESVVYQLVRLCGQRGEALPKRMVIAHLGSGCSVTALVDGRSVDTSMGLTPTGGVVMGTRPGDLDPGLLLYLLRQQPGSVEEAAKGVEAMLNHDAGLVALSGLPNDVKALREAAAKGNQQAVLALKVFTRSITKAIGGYAWLLGGVEAIVFTGGIGEHDARSRAEVLEGLEALGVTLDRALNEASGSDARSIGLVGSRTQVLVVPAEEDLMIARHVRRLAESGK